MQEVPEILQKWKGREKLLCTVLNQKYRCATIRVPPLNTAEMLEGCLEVKVPIRTVRQVAFKHGIPDTMRPVFWRILLGMLSTDKSLWAGELRDRRAEYEKYCEEFAIERLSLYKKYIADNSPAAANQGARAANMTQEEVVKANMQYEEDLEDDDELFDSVRKDVDRTHAERPFFRQSTVRIAMIRVLFTYAKLNPGVMYVQGMNEVLAVIFFTLKM